MNQSNEKLITIRCGRCKTTFAVQSNALTAVCACGVTNRIGRVVEKPISICCGNCQRIFDTDRDAKSATCTCGTVLHIGQITTKKTESSVVPNVSDSSSPPSSVDSPTRIRRTSGTEFVSEPLAGYSLQAEMSKARIGSIEKLFEVLDIIRGNLGQVHIFAQRFDVTVDPNVLRTVLSRLFISSSSALHAGKHRITNNEKELFRSLLSSAGITFVPVLLSQTSHQLFEFVTETIIDSAQIDGRVDASGVISGMRDLQLLFDRSFLIHGESLPKDYESKNARALVATILIWLSATVVHDLEEDCRFALMNESFRSLSNQEYVAQLWAFGREVARHEGWEWGS